MSKIQSEHKTNSYMAKEVLTKFLPDFERNFIPKADAVFTNAFEDPGFTESMNKVVGLSVVNPAQDYYTMLKRELYDISAFLETFASREEFELNRIKLQSKLKIETAEKQKLEASAEQKTGGFLGFKKVDKGVRVQQLTESIKDVKPLIKPE